MSARVSAAATIVLGVFAVLFAVAGNAWGAGFIGFVAGGWFITFVDEVWP